MLTGRPHEAAGNGSPRWMAAGPHNAGAQNPAYRPTRPPPTPLTSGAARIKITRRLDHQVATRLKWLGQTVCDGVAERSFLLNRRLSAVPGVLWSPETSARPPAVLLGHGGSGHKRSDRHLRMGRWLASTAGLAVVAIDGPWHGDRVASPLPSAVYQQLIVDEGIENVTARMTGDWLETVSALAADDLLDSGNVSIFGMSMGARFGLPAAAALGSRLRCAVFGKFGIRQAATIHPGLCSPGLMQTAAQAVSAPVLFHMQWDDEVFPRDGQLELFGALASDDKRLSARSGRHAETHPDDETAWQQFIGGNASALWPRSIGSAAGQAAVSCGGQLGPGQASCHLTAAGTASVRLPARPRHPGVPRRPRSPQSSCAGGPPKTGARPGAQVGG
jgi:dienelactone hydrolase